ncbi:hornerin-like isoform X1 [Haliotis rufescens]|uniref:hornerin-like isoform X1 n=1 Tax=Haliotis rufescens TaxID=6454 RepID=UPI001EAFCBB6|nr:hornerin-like isoform X1 [Haliotis rufescens]
MADKQKLWLWILPAVLLIAPRGQSVSWTQIANMESGDCDRIGPYTIDDTDILQVYASPPQIPGGSATRDSCVIEVRTAPNRRLRIYVMDVTIFDCGTLVYIYDGGTHMTTPTRTLKCETAPVKFNSRSEVLRIQLVKQSPSSLNFRYTIVLTTDEGPDIDFERDMSEFNSSPLSVGAIVGLSIAGGLLLVAVIAISIYCVVKQRKKNLEAEAQKRPPENNVYSTGSSKVMYQSRKDHNHKDNYKKPYSGSYDSRESSSNDSHNSSLSSGDGHVFVNMNPDPKVKVRGGGYSNKAFVPSEDGGHDRSRDSTGSEDTSGGYVNGSFESSDTPQKRRFSKHQENGNASGTLSRNGRRGSARSKSNKRRNSNEDKKGGLTREGSRRRSRSGNRGHRDSGRQRSRSNGEHGGSRRRSRSRSPHSQSSTQSTSFDKDGRNRHYNISDISRRTRESSNSSTSSRDSGDERTVSYDPNPPSRGRRSRPRERGDDYGSQV